MLIIDNYDESDFCTSMFMSSEGACFILKLTHMSTRSSYVYVTIYSIISKDSYYILRVSTVYIVIVLFTCNRVYIKCMFANGCHYCSYQLVAH